MVVGLRCLDHFAGTMTPGFCLPIDRNNGEEYLSMRTIHSLHRSSWPPSRRLDNVALLLGPVGTAALKPPPAPKRHSYIPVLGSKGRIPNRSQHAHVDNQDGNWGAPSHA
jgi:hypothetical protein